MRKGRKVREPRLSIRIFFVTSLCALGVATSAAQTLNTLYSFCTQTNCTDGAAPNSSLIQASDGNLYGTTTEGGTQQQGTVFRLTTGGVLTTLHSFCSQSGCTDGASPNAGLVQATDGNFYGTTLVGGDFTHCNFGCGTVFRITPSGVLTTLHSFNRSDGESPFAGLVQGTDGNLYGTTGGNAANYDLGTVFKITTGGSLTTIYTFSQSGFMNGAYPMAGLVQATDGNFYGTTGSGGTNGGGTVFSITPAGSLTTIYSFCAQSGCTDGFEPYSGLIQGTDGNFYGTTHGGGSNGDGTVFRITSGGFLTSLHSFNHTTDGTHPLATLIQANDGNFYGTNNPVGSVSTCNPSCGTVFRITSGGAFTTVHTFNLTDGAYPHGSLVQATDGSFYGTTIFGGGNSEGTVFRLVVFDFMLHVSTAGSGNVTSSDGNINCGTACSYNYPNGTVVTLTATPAQGWALANWSGCDSVNGDLCTVTVNNARNVAATFLPLYLLSVSANGNGVVASNDGFINCGANCTHSYLAYTSVALTASPAQGWALTGWTGCDAVHGNVCDVGLYRARNVTATFAATSLLTVTSGNGGTVISGDGRIRCGNACTGIYPNGSMLALTAVPAVGFTLNNWNGCTSVQGNVCRIAINAPVSVSAAFAPSSVAFSSLTFTPSTARHGSTAVGTLTLGSAAPSGGVIIHVSSSQPMMVRVPSILYIPGGASSFRFAAQVIGSRPTAITITATDGTTSIAGTLNIAPATRATISRSVGARLQRE